MKSLFRHLARWLVKIVFRVRVIGLEHYHNAGERKLVVANHVSLLDGMMLYLFLPEAPVFAVNRETLAQWWLRPWLNFAETLTIELLNPLSLKTAVRHLREGRTTMIFPEGRWSTTGTLMKVYDGPGMLADKGDASIVPVALDGLQYSRYTHLRRLHRCRWFPRVTLSILPARKLKLDDASNAAARRKSATAQISEIMREIYFHNAYNHESLFAGLVRAGRLHGRRRHVLADATGASLSYQDIITRAFVLGALIARHTSARERVGIMLPSTAAATVSLFACHARGREAAMLNFTGGARGLITAIETAGVRLVLTSRAFVEAGELSAEAEAIASNARLVYLEDLRDEIHLGHKLGGLLASRVPILAHRLFSRGCQPDDPAVVLFTSGSEGIPKGVALSHSNLMANFAQVQMLLDITQRDQVLNVLPTFHAFGLLGGVLLPLFKGTPTYQYPSPLHYRIIPELCYQLGVTCLFGTTTFLRGYARSASAYDFHAMRFVISGAEKMTDEIQQLWHRKFGIRIFEGYGATEASPVLAVNNPLANHAGSVGQLVTGMTHYIQPVEGIEDGGELVVSGPNVMLGYLFHGSDGEIIPPWTESHGAGWYETGDIVELNDDGFIKIKGRAKRFAKIGGEMVSLAAVEDLALGLWPDDSHAAVAVSDARKGEQIVLVTTVENAERTHLVAAAREQKVSELAIPRRLISTAQVPLLGSGKTDYAAVRDLVSNKES